MESSQDSLGMECLALHGENNMREEDILLSNQFAYSYIYSQAGLISFTLKSEVSNGAMRFILKKKRKKKIDSLFVNSFYLFLIIFSQFAFYYY